MKGKLNKVDNGYVLLVDNIMYATDNGKLSKQNCDEIFGVVDVKKLADKEYPKDGSTKQISLKKGFIEGFNKAMELNKDKVFTEQNLREIYSRGILGGESVVDRYIKALQPIEIEVEIEQVNKLNIDKGIFEWMPKLDSNGCLILKKSYEI